MSCPLERLKEIKTEKKKLQKYLVRSQKALIKNQKLLCKLDREQELILTPMLPGLYD
jgi:hypothetical protein